MNFARTLRQWFGFAAEDLPDQPSTNEIATRNAGRLAASLLKWLPNPDHILRKTGKRIEHLRDLTYDDEVFSAVQVLASSMREYEWELHTEDDAGSEAVDRATQWLTALDWERITGEMLDGRLYGFQPFEIEWTQEDGLWRPSDLVGKPQEWFVFTEDNELAFIGDLGATGDPEPVPAGKFICARHRPSYVNPYGQAVLSRCWWLVQFKKGGIRFWVNLAEKFGTPNVIGEHPRGASEDEVNNLLDMLAGLVRDNVAAIPDDSSVSFLDSPFKASSSSLYQDLVSYNERSIAKVLLSTELATTNAEHATNALGSAQIEQVSGPVMNACRRLMESTMQQLVRRMWHFNFEGGADDAPTFRMYQEEYVGKERSERDLNLSNAGVRLKEPYWKREYGLEDDDFELGPPPGAAPTAQEQATPFAAEHESGCQCPGCVAAFAEETEEGGQAALEELFTEVTEAADAADTNASMMEGLLSEPMRIVREASTETEAMEALTRAYPDMDAAEFERRVANLLFIGRMWGRIRENEDIDDTRSNSS